MRGLLPLSPLILSLALSPAACHALLAGGRAATFSCRGRGRGLGRGVGRHSTALAGETFRVRDWSGEDGEAGEALRLLVRAAASAGGGGDGGSGGGSSGGRRRFDPEGPLEVDVGSAARIAEAYDPSDGGCLLVAEAAGAGGGDGMTSLLVGTVGLVLGTQVEYLRSGASVSAPRSRITGALRRACCLAGGGTEKERILRALLAGAEDRAREGGADVLVALAYPEEGAGGKEDQEAVVVRRPDASLLERCGYSPLPTQLGGGGIDVVQYGKELVGPDGESGGKAAAAEAEAEAAAAIPGGGTGAAAADAAVALSLALTGLALLLGGVAALLGLDVGGGSADNRGIGAPLTREELVRLREDERLQRTDLDGGSGGGEGREGGARRWEDLRNEERREEEALLQIIQGRDVRIR